MAHYHLADVKRTQSAKVEGVVGHTKHYQHPSDKADGMASQKQPYFQNRKLDPPAIPTKKSVGP